MVRRLLRAGWPASPLAFTVLAVGLAAAVAAVLAVTVAGVGSVTDVAHHLHPGWLAVAAGAEVVAYLGYLAAYREALRADSGPRLGLRRVGELVLAGFGAHIPGGGFAGDLRELRHECGARGEAAVRVLGLGVLEYAILAPAATVAAAVLLAEGASVPLSVTVPWVAAVPVGFALAGVCAARVDHERLRSSHRRAGRALGSALAALALVRTLGSRPLHHAPAWLGIAAYWAGDILCLYAGLRAFGADPSVAATILAYATGYVATRRSLPLAGAAATEALLVFALSWVGIPFAVALAGVVAYRAFNFLLAIPPGLLAHRRSAAVV